MALTVTATWCQTPSFTVATDFTVTRPVSFSHTSKVSKPADETRSSTSLSTSAMSAVPKIFADTPLVLIQAAIVPCVSVFTAARCGVRFTWSSTPSSASLPPLTLLVATLLSIAAPLTSVPL